MIQNIKKNLFRSFKRNYKTQIITVFTLSLTFSILVSFWNVYGNLKTALFGWGDQLKLDVFLKDEASNGDLAKIESIMKSSPHYKSHKYISKEDAAKNFKKRLGDLDAELLSDETVGNPLPNSFELHLLESVSVTDRVQSIKNLALKLISIEGVDEASYGQSWVKHYKKLIQGFSSTSFGIMIVLFLGSLFIIGNEINNSIQSRTQEIEIYELIGATPFRIQAPFLIEGALLGFVSMLSSLIIGFFISIWQKGILITDLSFLNIYWGYIQVWGWVGFLFLGTTVGMVGSYISVRKINTKWSSLNKGSA